LPITGIIRYMTDDRSQIEEIKEKIDIVNLISKYVELRPAGKNFSGLCPFHTEKTPSFIVSPDIQRYKCFGCGKSGDIFNFVQEIENLDFPETLEKLAKEAGVELKKTKRNPQIEKLEQINRKTAEYYFKELKKTENSKALNYVTKEREFTEETIRKFALGYAPGKRQLASFLRKEFAYTEQVLLSSGLFTKKDNILKEKFFKRIMFPIRNSQGKFIGFSGRVLPGDNLGPKYMNTPETPIFHKKDNLFGLYESRQEIRKLDLAIICEGQTDVISAHQNGIKNIVAPLGTALTKEQLEKLSHFTKNILFFFDSDEAGQKAMVRGFKMASELKLHPYGTNSSPYKDIDEMIKKDLKKLKARISKKRDAFSYLLLTFLENKDLTNYEDYNQIQKFISDLLSSVEDKTAFNFYKTKAEKVVGVLDKNATQKSFKKEALDKRNITNDSHEKDNSQSEKSYLSLLLMKESIELPENHDLTVFNSEDIKKVLKYIKGNPGESRQRIFKETDKDLVEELIFSSSRTITLTHDHIDKELDDIYSKISDEAKEKTKENLRVKIALAEEKGDTKKSQDLLKEYQNLFK
jgi:DNA primase